MILVVASLSLNMLKDLGAIEVLQLLLLLLELDDNRLLHVGH